MSDFTTHADQRAPIERALRLALISLSLACVACASVNVQPLGSQSGAETSPSRTVAVLTAFPASPYRALARIEVRDRGLGRPKAQLRKRLLEEASSLGAEAVVLERSSTRRSVGGALQPILLYDDRLVAGTAIVYVQDGPPPSAT